MAEINIGQISEALNDKADRDLHNVDTTVKADAIIDFQAPTAENNYTWYRKYKSGWVEQGGAIIGLTDWADRTITLPITMRDRGYSYVQSPIMNTSTGPGAWAIGVTLKTETQITSRFYANNGFLPTWQVSGVSA